MQQHSGNLLNQVSFEEHDGTLNAKKVSLVSGATIYAVVNTAASGQASVVIDGNVTLSDPKGFVGLVTLGGGFANLRGNVTLDAGSRTGILGNLTIDSGNISLKGNVTIDSGNISLKGNVTLDVGSLVGIRGNLTLSDSKGFIGLVSVSGFASPMPVLHTGAGNVTLSDSKGFVGLVTNIPAYGSNSTVYTGVISSTGNTTVVVAPASNRFFIKNIHISSLGRSEVEVRSNATTLIPFTSLSTTSGFAAHYGEQGLPARAQTDAIVLNLNGGATISYMFNIRFEA